MKWNGEPFANRLPTILPLPGGEGRGEGGPPSLSCRFMQRTPTKELLSRACAGRLRFSEAPSINSLAGDRRIEATQLVPTERSGTERGKQKDEGRNIFLPPFFCLHLWEAESGGIRSHSRRFAILLHHRVLDDSVQYQR